MLSIEHLEFCKEVKRLSLEDNGNKLVGISCEEFHPNSILTSAPIFNYITLLDIFKKIGGKNYDNTEENNFEQYKDCKKIFLHYAIQKT